MKHNTGVQEQHGFVFLLISLALPIFFCTNVINSNQFRKVTVSLGNTPSTVLKLIEDRSRTASSGGTAATLPDTAEEIKHFLRPARYGQMPAGRYFFFTEKPKKAHRKMFLLNKIISSK